MYANVYLRLRINQNSMKTKNIQIHFTSLHHVVSWLGINIYIHSKTFSIEMYGEFGDNLFKCFDIWAHKRYDDMCNGIIELQSDETNTNRSGICCKHNQRGMVRFEIHKHRKMRDIKDKHTYYVSYVKRVPKCRFGDRLKWIMSN